MNSFCAVRRPSAVVTVKKKQRNSLKHCAQTDGIPLTELSRNYTLKATYIIYIFLHWIANILNILSFFHWNMRNFIYNTQYNSYVCAVEFNLHQQSFYLNGFYSHFILPVFFLWRKQIHLHDYCRLLNHVDPSLTITCIYVGFTLLFEHNWVFYIDVVCQEIKVTITNIIC